jgi:hypothetical protein
MIRLSLALFCLSCRRRLLPLNVGLGQGAMVSTGLGEMSMANAAGTQARRARANAGSIGRKRKARIHHRSRNDVLHTHITPMGSRQEPSHQHRAAG